MSTELSTVESQELDRHEEVIARGLNTFVEVGTALLRIRDGRLYRRGFDTFETYCRDRWGMSRQRANQLVDAAQVAGNLTTTVVTPVCESQARPLVALEPEQQREAWGRAVETAPNGKVTADHVKSVVNEMFSPRDAPKPQPWSESEYERKELVEAGETVTANIRTDIQLIAWAEENGLYMRIDRQTAWGNPFILGDDGERDDVCDSYRIYLQYKPSLQRRYEELRGKVLGCWCYPERCHGNELIRESGCHCSHGEHNLVGCHK